MFRLFPLFLGVAFVGCIRPEQTRSALRDELLVPHPGAAPSSSAAPNHAEPPADGEALSRDQMIAAYLVSSPELHASDATVEARLARIDVAGSVSAPEVMLQAWNVPFRTPYAIHESSMWMAMINQRFDARGIRRARVREESAEARALAEQRASVALGVAVEAARDHATLAQLDAILVAKQGARVVYDDLVRAAESLIAGGRGDTRMVAEARAMRSETEAAIIGLVARRAALARVANVRMGRAPTEELVVDVGEEEVDIPSIRASLGEHPSLRASEARREAAEARIEAATHASRRPELSVGAGVVGGRHDSVGYGLQVGISLPWIGGRARAERRVAIAEAAAVDSERSTSSREVAIEFERTAAELVSARAAIAAIDEQSLPALELSARTTTSGLASGASSIRDVVAITARTADLRVERAEREGERLVAEAMLLALAAYLGNTSNQDGLNE